MRIVPVVLALGLSVTGALAQDYPCSQVKVVVPYPAGGATDVATRVVAERLEAALKKSFIVENRGGATGNIGTAAVVTAPPDGCTLLVNATVIASFPTSFSKLSYDPFKDLAPVGGIGVTPTLMIAAPSIPANDIKSLVEWSKSKPDGLNYSTAGYGLQQHLAIGGDGAAHRRQVRARGVPWRRHRDDRPDGGAHGFRRLPRRHRQGPGRRRQAQGAGGRAGQALRAHAERADHRGTGPARLQRGGRPFHDVRAGRHAQTGHGEARSANCTRSISDPALKQRFIGIGFEATPMTGEEVAAAMRRTEAALVPVIKRLNIKLD